MNTAADQYLFGYLLSPPGPEDWGTAIDEVPQPEPGVDLAAAHQQWKTRVEQDLANRLNSGQISLWYPLSIPTNQPILPMIGGDPTTDWRESVAVLADQAFAAGHNTVRIVDLTRLGVGAGLADDFRQNSPDRRVLSATLSPGQTSSSVLGGLDTAGVIDLVADVLRADDTRQGRNEAARHIQMLRRVARCLVGKVTLTRLAEAARYALTLDDSVGSLTDPEMLDLENYHSRHLKNRRSNSDGLDELELLLNQLAFFDASEAPDRSGRRQEGTVTVRTITTHGSGANHELAADLLAARLAREMTTLDNEPGVVTVLLGADQVSTVTLKMIRDAATRNNSRLFLFFERFAGEAVDLIGSSGASMGGFFRLANNHEAEAAAEFMGRQHRFELTGRSQGSTRSFEWGWSSTTGMDRSTSRSVDTGRLFSSTVSRSISRSQSNSTSGGGSAGRSNTTEYSRVYEYLLEPATFQGLPTGSLLMVDVASRSSAMVACSQDVHRSKVASRQFVLELSNA